MKPARKRWDEVEPEPTDQGHDTTLVRYYRLTDPERWFRVDFARKSGWVSVSFLVVGFDDWGEDHGPFYSKAVGAVGGFGITQDPTEAEVYFSGHVKWDGCSNLELPDHTCSRFEFGHVAELLECIWDQCAHMHESAARECMGRAGPLRHVDPLPWAGLEER